MGGPHSDVRGLADAFGVGKAWAERATLERDNAAVGVTKQESRT